MKTPQHPDYEVVKNGVAEASDQIVMRVWVPPREAIPEWTRGHWRCTAEEISEQIKCKMYKASTTAERDSICPAADDFTCVHCECGCSDVCTA